MNKYCIEQGNAHPLSCLFFVRIVLLCFVLAVQFDKDRELRFLRASERERSSICYRGRPGDGA